MKKVYDFNRAVDQKKIEQDNNKILENVIERLENAISYLPEKGQYEFTIHDENGIHTENKSREFYLRFMIDAAIEELSEHSYFYEKEGIDKYEGEIN